MTKDEAIKVLGMVEAHGLADEAKSVAIEALNAEAIPVKWIQRKIDMLEQNMDSDLPKLDMLAQLHELVSLKRLVTDWEKEKWKEE